MNELSRHLASNLIHLRRARNWSQQRLAQRAELPRTTLANMESGRGNPSLHNLSRVAAALNVSFEELLARPRSACRLIKATELPQDDRNDGFKIIDLLPEKVRGLEIVRMHLAAGSQRVGRPHLLGTHEYLHGLKGCVSVLVNGELYRVEAGDVLAFAGDQAHSYLNRERGAAEAVSVVVPVNTVQLSED
ncbi:MAG: helix-turn-helix domain-containing protein [Oceanococcus sp.]